jgi:hypothetical protein
MTVETPTPSETLLLPLVEPAADERPSCAATSALLPLRAANCVLLLFVDDVLDVTLARLGAAVFAVPCSRQEVTPCRQNARQG